MPKLNGINLPTVTVEIPEEVVSAVKREKFSPEAMVELAIYLKRQKAHADALNDLEAAVKAKIEEYYDGLAENKRDTVRTEAGMVTYAAPKETIKLRDRDATVEALSAEQLRASYKPDIKALEIMLKPDEFERHVTRETAKKGTITIRDSKGAFEEIDVSDF
jgi:hypothetical protein